MLGIPKRSWIEYVSLRTADRIREGKWREKKNNPSSEIRSKVMTKQPILLNKSIFETFPK